jgi:hypothetical protein
VRVVNEDLLEECRLPGRCEFCGKYCKVREPHHLFCNGMGSGSRLDIRINLIALGSTYFWQCECHRLAHAGTISREALLAIVAVREGRTPEQITEEIWRLRRKAKQS